MPTRVSTVGPRVRLPVQNHPESFVGLGSRHRNGVEPARKIPRHKAKPTHYPPATHDPLLEANAQSTVGNPGQ